MPFSCPCDPFQCVHSFCCSSASSPFCLLLRLLLSVRLRINDSDGTHTLQRVHELYICTFMYAGYGGMVWVSVFRILDWTRNKFEVRREFDFCAGSISAVHMHQGSTARLQGIRQQQQPCPSLRMQPAELPFRPTRILTHANSGMHRQTQSVLGCIHAHRLKAASSWQQASCCIVTEHLLPPPLYSSC